MYHSGTGTAKDAKQAFRWYLKASKQNDNASQFELATMYGKGDGVARDDNAAYAWFTIVGENGEAKAAPARDKMAGRLTPAQISEAKKLARKWSGVQPESSRVD